MPIMKCALRSASLSASSRVGDGGGVHDEGHPRQGGRTAEVDMQDRLAGITVDCRDPARLASLWGALLNVSITTEHDGPGWSGERHDYDEGVVLVMQDPEDHEFCLVQYY